MGPEGHSVDLRRRPSLQAALAGGGLIVCAAVALLQAHEDKTGSLSLVLAFAAIASGAGVAAMTENASISGSFIVVILAAAFLGPASACLAWVLAEVTASVRRHTALE